MSVFFCHTSIISSLYRYVCLLLSHFYNHQSTGTYIFLLSHFYYQQSLQVRLSSSVTLLLSAVSTSTSVFFCHTSTISSLYRYACLLLSHFCYQQSLQVRLSSSVTLLLSAVSTSTSVFFCYTCTISSLYRYVYISSISLL